MSKQLYIHIGINKTGSTAIESYCVDHYDTLLKKNVSFFPKPHFYKFCWPIYFDNPKSPKPDEQLQKSFQTVINKAKTDKIFLIDEDLTGLNPFFEGFLKRYTPTSGTFISNINNRITKWKHLTANYNTTFIIYIRRQDLFLESLYTQLIKQRHFFSLTFNEFIQKYPLDSLNWHQLATTLTKQLKKVIIRPFETQALHHQDIVLDCLHQCNIDLSNLEKSKRENTRLKADYFEPIRHFNTVKTDVSPLHVYRKTPPNCCQTIHDETYGFMTPKQRQELLNKFSESNKKCGTTFLNKDILFNTEKAPKHIINQKETVTLTSKQIQFFTNEYFSFLKKN